MNACYSLDIVWSNLQMLSDLIFTVVLWYKYNYSHFVGQNIGSAKLGNLPKDITSEWGSWDLNPNLTKSVLLVIFQDATFSTLSLLIEVRLLVGAVSNS